MSFRRAIAVGLVCLFGGWSTAFGAEPVRSTLTTSQRNFSVTSFQIPGTESRPVVLILGGARGYESTAYSRLATDLNASKIDVFLIHYISDVDAAAIESASSSKERIAFYAKRMAEWSETIRVTTDAVRRQPKYQSRIGVLGISLGAMPVTAISANNSDIAASTVVDGGFPANFRTRVRSMPPMLMIWGSDDRVFPLSTGAKLRDLARSLGVPAELRAYPGEGHGFFLEQGNTSAHDARQTIVRFFSSRLRDNN